MTGISEWFDIEIPRVPSLYDGRSADFLYKPSAAVESQWTGAWGILRVYRNDGPIARRPAGSRWCRSPPTTRPAGRPTPDTSFDEISRHPGPGRRRAGSGRRSGARVTSTELTAPSDGARPGADRSRTVAHARGTRHHRPVACPADRTVRRTYNIAAVSAAEVLQNDPIGMPGLVYNPRAASVTGPAGSFSGPLYDPTAIMFVDVADLTYVGSPARPRLNQNVRREPLILRARAGECIKVTLTNLTCPTKYADKPGLQRRQHDRRRLQPERRQAFAWR